MIRQMPVAIKTAETTLTLFDMGDIVGNSDIDFNITLPNPSAGLWYRISNIGAGVLTVYFGFELTRLKQTEQCLCLANGESDWFFSKGSGFMNKNEIETVLTGELTSHSHALPTINIEDLPEINFDDLNGVPAFTGNAGKIPKVNAAENGIEFVDGSVAENGIPVGGTENQLFAKNSNADFDGKWVDAPQASNGLPPGGTEGQVLSKYSATDFDTSWIDAISGSGFGEGELFILVRKGRWK